MDGLKLALVAITAAAIAVAASAAPGAAEGGRRVLYAGFAFSGDYANRRQLYPYSAEISEELSDGVPVLDKLLHDKLLARPDLARRVIFELSDEQQDLSTVAFALVQENVETQKVDGKYWVIVALQANVLAFNKASNSVVASYPLRMRFTRVRDTAPTPADLKSMIREAYTTEVAEENILEQWLTRFERIKMLAGARKYLRVTDVMVSPEANRIILAAGKTVMAIRNQVANFLEAALAEKSGVPVVPNSVGEAIGSKMAYRFASGKSLELLLPQPDFSVTFSIRDFVSTTLEEPQAFQDIYRVKASINLKQPDLGKVILDENVYNTLFVTRPKRADVQLLDWDQYFKTLQSLVFMVGRQVSKVEDEWLKENASRALEARPGFLRSNQLFQELQ